MLFKVVKNMILYYSDYYYLIAEAIIFITFIFRFIVKVDLNNYAFNCI